ncbi:GAP family protein [Microlunatus elymi]|uniref:GAP family protein n=1 Tax=Microlunatus elymi TaxID=2596828 RepID=A0A516Q076_9ACTN|nr:GAP family protein [Microlunatus elymi]QDP96797.1 GAP family protein [Microlunatus elymi]
MGQAIGDILPIALGVAISPMPIMAVILMLMSPRGRGASVTFLLGWVLGIAVVLTVVTLVIGPASGSDSSGPSPVASIIKIVLGVLALFLAFRQWRGRPKPGQTPQLPKWMAAIDKVTPAKAFGLGALLSGINPKNLTLCLAGGVAIGSVGLDAGQAAVVIVIFVLIGSCTVAIPVIAFLAAQKAVQPKLDELRGWLGAHNAAVMSVLLLVIGVTIIGKGVAGL